MSKYIVIIFFGLIFCSCNSIQKNIIGDWKISSVINDENAYAPRSSLIPQAVESEMQLSLKSDGTFTSNGDLCTGNWKETKDNLSRGKFYMPQYMKINKTFRLEADKCPGIGGDHRIKIINGKLELYYPSVTGYRIQIFEKIKK
ncbi:hypothetical protein ACFQO9_10210 [Chryseobacterium zhengzhouense]|uniref:Lipocalin-like domain-containing protein n=1 Tax=Chryseobacterium zhengzhouense TaxID=1636086 RepID=A0ABW2LXP6_9FLAO